MPAPTIRRRILVTGSALAVCGGIALPVAVAATPTDHAPPAASAPAPQASAVLGEIIESGIRDHDGEVVFYFRAVDTPELPGTDFGVVGGYRCAASGEITGEYANNETSGQDTAPGFHAVGDPGDGSPVPVFGYYAGPVETVTARVDGTLVHAEHARWSENPDIVLFWFDPATGASAGTVTDLSAFAADGTELPEGHNTIGVG